ncbi:MAG: hypothetical protein LPK43_05525 [Gammaproteobacteria bacterium]|nr:hypothetical protein [Gammaproteobacteria bacterium]
MNRLAVLILSLAFSFPVMASDDSKEEPVQHLKIEEVTSLEDAKRIFAETTAEMRGKQKLDVTELQQIHVITYSLEKSVAYFVENTEGERHELAEEIAEVVEEIHLSSENNREEETKALLNKYFDMADRFAAGF